MNRISTEDQEDIIANLVEGNSVRGTARLVKITPNTVLDNLIRIGDAALKFHHEMVREVTPTKIVADELWNFIYGKDKNLPPKWQGNRSFGDMYTWIGYDPNARLVISWHIGKRDFEDAQIFATDLGSRIVSPRVQITTDQLSHYRTAFFEAFGDRADYATLRKASGLPIITPDGKIERPEDLKTHRRATVFGNPNMEEVSTAAIESFNLLIRMSNGRYMRSSNRFSRKIENQRAGLAIYFVHHNWCRTSPPIRVTPAMEAGLADHIWEIEELLAKLKIDPS